VKSSEKTAYAIKKCKVKTPMGPVCDAMMLLASQCDKIVSTAGKKGARCHCCKTELAVD
jgi:hypothetical protein